MIKLQWTGTIFLLKLVVVLDYLLILCVLNNQQGNMKYMVKGAAPLCNLSVWEPRCGGFTWSWEA